MEIQAIKTCPSFNPDTHRAVPDEFDPQTDGAGGTQWVQRIEALTTAEIAAARVRAINADRDRRLLLGAPYAGKRIDVSDKGRADLGGMSIAALLAQSGVVPWPDGYALGWITQDNSRVTLPSPADGLTLAATVGDWYGRVVQNARTLKDAVLAAAAPLAVDVSEGWPD